MTKIRIANWLLTRRCNLDCSYCAINKDYHNLPEEYPKIKHYHKNEMSTKFIINGLKNLKFHNPDCFNIFYGGEPTMRSDLPDIINYCNKHDIHYTIITNNSDQVQPLIQNLLDKTEYISGLTSSVDPIIFSDDITDDIMKKSISGINRLSQYKGIIKDRVAEITITKNNMKYIYPLVKQLSDYGISSSITFVDIEKSSYYDFSNVYDKNILVKNNKIIQNQFERIFKENLDIHMGEDLINQILSILPSNLNCDLDENFHNITIDADGSIRLCLRIRGTSTPDVKLNKIFMENGKINPFLKVHIGIDKRKYCKGCNWTCVLMSKMVNDNINNKSDLLHLDRR